MLKRSHLLILLLFCIPLFFINIHDSHLYGDDWAQYLKQALNIVNGLPYYSSGYIFNPLSLEYAPPQYPPGYSLLLAPVVYFTGTSIIPLMYLNTVLVCFLLFAGYYFFTAKTSKTIALCLALIFAYLSVVIELKGQILSDIACTLFITIYFAVRAHTGIWSYQKVLLLVVIGLFAVLIRTQSLLLVFAEFFIFLWSYLVKKERDKSGLIFPPNILILLGVTGIFVILNFTVFHAPVSAISFYKNIYTKVLPSKDLWDVAGYNLNYLLALLNGILFHKMNDYFFHFFVSIITTSSLCLFMLGTIVSLRKKLEFEVVFMFMMILLILITPVHQGLRYFLPVVPVYLWMVARGMNKILPVIGMYRPALTAIACTIVFLALGFDEYESAGRVNKPYSIKAVDSSAFKFINENVGKDEIILFPKPRLLALYTDKKTMYLSPGTSIEENRHQFDSMGVKYLLSCRYLNEDHFNRYLNTNPSPYSDSKVINEDYILYTLKKN